MPEGDTLHRIARRIGPSLVGRSVSELRTSDLGVVLEARGWRIDGVRALGKHLLVQFDAPWTLRTHLGMHGRVWLARARQTPPASPVFALSTAGSPSVTVFCSGAYRAELIRNAHLAGHPRLARLGPDLLGETLDLDEVVRRARQPGFSGREVADVLLDQRVAAGIGNVYKSEVLFLTGVHPTTPMGRLGRDTVRALYAESARLLRLNLRTRKRTTVPTRRRPMPDSPRLWVYGRAGKPCLECASPIERMHRGDMARSSYFCASCQALAD